MAFSKQRGHQARMPCARACLDRARERVEASVAARELGEYRVQVNEATNVSIIAHRTGWNPKRSSTISFLFLGRLCIIILIVSGV